MKYLLFVCFIIFTIIHLKDSFLDDANKRKKSKAFPLLFLILFYLSASNNISYYLLFALIFCLLGDILLIPKGNKWFMYGGISFLLCHLFFVLVYSTNIALNNIPYLFIIPIALIYLIISLRIILMLKETTPKFMIVPMYLYLLSNSLMNCFALIQLINNKNIGSTISYIGALLFFISDCLLFLVRYYKKPEIVYKKHFSVMLTYLLGTLLITIGTLILH